MFPSVLELKKNRWKLYEAHSRSAMLVKASDPSILILVLLAKEVGQIQSQLSLKICLGHSIYLENLSFL